MLASIRRFVYKLGFRPKSGTIMHSPSFLSPEVSRQIAESVQRGFEGAAQAMATLARMPSPFIEINPLKPSEKLQDELDIELALKYVHSVYDRHRAPESLEWVDMEPRVRAYLEHLFKSSRSPS